MTDTTNPQQTDRRDRYAAAIRETDGWVLDGGQHMLDAVMAVADAEQAALRREHADRLEHLEGALSRIRDRAEVAQVRVRRVVACTPFAAAVEEAFAGGQFAAVTVPASAPTDRAALRDRIVAAIKASPFDELRAVNHAPNGPLQITVTVDDLADTLLRRLADAAFAPGMPCEHGCRAAADELTREAQQPETQARRMMRSRFPSRPGTATVASDMCPRCKGDNSEAWALCARCADEPAAVSQPDGEA
jgi:hypothetical protein